MCDEGKPSRGIGVDRHPATPVPDGTVETALRTIESQFAVVMGDPCRVEEAGQRLEEVFQRDPSPDIKIAACLRLLPLLARRGGPLAAALYDRVEGWILRPRVASGLIGGLVETRDPALRRRAIGTIADLIQRDIFTPDLDLVTRIARTVESAKARSPDEPEVLEQIGRILAGVRSERPVPAERSLVRFLLAPSAVLRRLTARILDLDGRSPSPEIISEVLGPEGARILAPYLDYTRADHQDLVALTPVPGMPPPVLDSIAEAEAVGGRRLVKTVIAELGWSRVRWGLSVEPLTGVSVSGSFPFVLRPSEAGLFRGCRSSQSLWTRCIFAAYGSSDDLEPSRAGGDTAVQRFRRYNLDHATVLRELLRVSPLTVARGRRILALSDRLVTGFLDLFGSVSEDADRLPPVFDGLKAAILDAVSGLAGDAPVPGSAARQVIGFEDPQSMDEIRTLHGLKRYLHQQGLRHAFRRFRSGQTANRTVDLVLTAADRIVATERKIRYIDFEPAERGRAGMPPFVVSVLVQAFGRHIVHGGTNLPSTEVLCYGNEVQVFVNFRNHPAFLRIDLSPPTQGGMIDLEYFGVSQYEIDHHPDLTLGAIQLFFQRLDFAVSVDTFHIHARYDKERTIDPGEIVRKTRAVFSLLPHLMDVDWIIGSLDYPPESRPAIAAAWAEFFTGWGVLPLQSFLSADRRRVVESAPAPPAGSPVATWDGRGPYVHPFSRGTAPDPSSHLAENLDRAGLGHLVRWDERGNEPLNQTLLDAVFLAPLREAVARGEAVETGDGFQRGPAELYRPDHAVARLTDMLLRGGDRAVAGHRLARVVASIEHLLRFEAIGDIHGHPVERSLLSIRGDRVGLYVLRDGVEAIRLALAADGDVLYRFRTKPGERWRDSAELDCGELLGRLRRNNLLLPDDEPETMSDEIEISSLINSFRAPGTFAGRAEHSGEHGSEV